MRKEIPQNLTETELLDKERPTGKTEVFYLTKEQTEALRLETSMLTPEQQRAYSQLEKFVGQKFIEVFGEYLTLAQKEYMKSSVAIAMDQNTMKQFIDSWGIAHYKDRSKAILHGVIYHGYRPKGQKGDFHAGNYSAVEIPTGRIPVIPPQTRDANVDYRMLISLDDFKRAAAGQDFTEANKSSDLWFNTVIWGGNVLHEKVHGMQDLDLSFPFQEISAYYYQREIFERMNWFRQETNFDLAIDYWRSLIDEIGEDLHRLVLGNLEDKRRRKEVLAILKKKFTKQVMNDLLPDVEWISSNKN